MAPHLKKVDGRCSRYSALLTWLQLEILPGDIPATSQEGHWWIAFDGGHPVAFAGLYASKQDPLGGYLCRSGVVPQARGLRLQKRLLKVRELYAKRMGLKTLYSDTYDNPYSSNNLIKAGFVAFDAPVRYGAVGTNYWRKDI